MLKRVRHANNQPQYNADGLHSFLFLNSVLIELLRCDRVSNGIDLRAHCSSWTLILVVMGLKSWVMLSLDQFWTILTRQWPIQRFLKL